MAGFDLEVWLDSGVARTTEVKLCLRPDLIAKHVEAEIALSRATKTNRTNRAQAVVDLETEIEAASKVFKLTAVSPREWADLRRAHLPTASQLIREPNLDHNPDTFPSAAVAACSVDPELSYEQVEKLRESPKVDFGEWQKLWLAVADLNLEVAAAPKSLAATAVLSRNGGSSTTAARKGSRGPSS